MSFSDLGLVPELLRAVADKGYDVALPHPSSGHPGGARRPRRPRRRADRHRQDRRFRAAHLAALPPIRQRLAAARPRVLVLTPTRELAAQVAQSARDYGKYMPLRAMQVFGGVNINPQIRRSAQRLRHPGGDARPSARPRSAARRRPLEGADPGAGRSRPHAGHGFHPRHPADHQAAAVEAAEPAVLRHLFGRYPRAGRAAAARSAVDPGGAAQRRRSSWSSSVPIGCRRSRSAHLLVHLIQEGNWHQVLVFTRTKHGANRLTQQLEGAGIRAAAIHGNKSQAARVKALDMFKHGAGHARWWPRRSRRAASTSRSCRRW